MNEVDAYRPSPGNVDKIHHAAGGSSQNTRGHGAAAKGTDALRRCLEASETILLSCHLPGSQVGVFCQTLGRWMSHCSHRFCWHSCRQELRWHGEALRQCAAGIMTTPFFQVSSCFCLVQRKSPSNALFF